MKKKLAIQQLIEWADDFVETRKASPNIHQLTKKAKELLALEKKQIKDAYEASSENDLSEYAENYYNQTYNQ